MWRQEDLFFSGLGGGAPTGEPVGRPEELAERVAAGGDGLTFFPTPPLMHGTSTLTAFIGFNFGQTVVLHRKFVPEEVLRTIEKEKVTSVSLVGDAMLRPLIDALDRAAEGHRLLLAVQRLLSSGAIMSETVRAAVRGAGAARDAAEQLRLLGVRLQRHRHRGLRPRAGLPAARQRPYGRWSTRRPTNRCAPGEPGRIAQRGHVPLGYYNDPKKTAETFFEADGERWVLLGDMATVDEDGVVTVLGRGSQCINTGGEKVYPEEVEQALKAHPDVYDALVAGVPDERWGNRVAAVVQLREGAARARRLDDVQDALPHPARRLQDPPSVVFADRHPALAQRQGGLPLGPDGRGGVGRAMTFRPAVARPGLPDARTPGQSPQTDRSERTSATRVERVELPLVPYVRCRARSAGRRSTEPAGPRRNRRCPGRARH